MKLKLPSNAQSRPYPSGFVLVLIIATWRESLGQLPPGGGGSGACRFAETPLATGRDEAGNFSVPGRVGWRIGC